MAFLVPKLVGLRSEFNHVAPNRDKESDGWIGNQRHQQYVSGHNPDESGKAEFQDPDNLDEVRAIDIDDDLRTPGLTMAECVEYLRLECRAGRITWIYYIIYQGRICSATNNWAWRPYSGTNPHNSHAHISTNLRGDTQGYTPVGLSSLLPQPEETYVSEQVQEDVIQGTAEFLAEVDAELNGTATTQRSRHALRRIRLIYNDPVVTAINDRLNDIEQIISTNHQTVIDRLDALQTAVEEGSGNVDVAAILAGVKALLSHTVLTVEADTN